MRFGFIFFGRDLHAVGPIARLGEQQGFELIGLCDSPSLAFDPYVALSLAALDTSRVRLGPAVTNPQTRHPLIIANLAAGLEQLAPERSYLGLGTGNSGVRHAGAGPATLETLVSTVSLARRLLAGETVEVEGAKMVVKGAGRRVPILLAGSGPRSLRLAGQMADVVFVNVGVTSEVVADGLRWVRQGAEAAGRDPKTVEPWVFAIGAVAADRAQALDEAKGAAVAIAAYILRGDSAAKRIPSSVQQKVEQLLREYEYGEHLTPGRTANYYLAERLGIADYLLDRFTIAGNPDDCRRKIEDLRAVGADNVCLSLSAAPDVATYVRLFGEAVLPKLMGRHPGS
jgi:5,10-methylenetetrahydromethanopterin reductase